jgi:hypothetical protein
MQSRLLTAAIAAAFLGAGPTAAAVMLQSTSDIFCHDDSCFGIDRGVGSNRSVTVGGLTFDRLQLGGLGASLVHVTLWSSDGAQMVGDFGNFTLSALAGNQLTLTGPNVTFDSSIGGIMFRFDRVDVSGGGGGSAGSGGSGGGAFIERGFDGGRAIVDEGGAGAPNDPGSFGAASGGSGVSTSPGPGPNPAQPPRGIPEPADWALMLLGFAGLGGVLRYRRAARTV